MTAFKNRLSVSLSLISSTQTEGKTLKIHAQNYKYSVSAHLFNYLKKPYALLNVHQTENM
jgi:hypothetical protein